MEKREHVIHYMLQGHVHLSKKDYGFFHNLQHLIKETKKVTSNQSKLFEKLLAKYQRQLKKNGYNYTDLASLPWHVEVVESKQEFLDAKIYFEDDTICIKAPFNNNFITNLRNQEPNCYAWDKTNKLYRANKTTYNLKMALDLVTKHYGSAKTCDEVTSILRSLDFYKNTCWKPTLVRKNNLYYISCISETIYNRLPNYELNSDPKTLYQLAILGITIDNDIVKDSEFLRFVSEYNTTIQIEQLNQFVNWIKDLEVDYVWLTRDLVYNKKISKMVTTLLDEVDIKYGSSSNSAAKNIVRLTLSNHHIRSVQNGISHKTIMIRNSLAVNVK